MQWTFDWLLDYLDTKATADDIAGKLTEIGLEVEGMSMPSVPVAAKIIECSDIEGTHLHLLKVDDGNKIRQVVCGAPNVRAGLVSALARPGTMIGDVEIKVGKIRGFDSEGMMCSEKELGESDNHDGIIELGNIKLGAPWNGAAGDPVFDAKVLPNRADYLAVRGIARDLAATGIGKLKTQNGKLTIKNIDGKRKAIIKNKDRCPVYDFLEIDGIKLAPSSEKIAARLAAIGINPKNAPVDATNYVCYDLGQPLHCFDADEIHGDIVIRNAKDGEKFTDLFGAEHILTADDLVITDADGILALAGIVGGMRGMTTEKTRNIILESAYFEPIGIRKTRRRLNISTDASYRYERGIDPMTTGRALAECADIIMKECGGKITASRLSDFDFKKSVIPYDPELFPKKTGIEVPEKMQKEILESLGYIIEKDWSVIQPSWRVDDAIPEKLISDIVRIYGYDKIGMTGVTFVQPARKREKIPTYEDAKIFFAKNRNLTESVSFGFGNLLGEKMVSEKTNIEIANPIADYMNTARNSLIPNMLDAVANNEKRGFPDLSMFELGTVFDGPNPGGEHKQLVIARTGMFSPRHWLKRARAADVFDVKADLLAYFGADGVATETGNAPMWAHPYRYGRLVRGGKILAEFGELHPRLAKHWRIKTNVILGLADDIPVSPAALRDGNLESLPPITRDFSFVLEKEIPAAAVVSAARMADARISMAREFDFYENSIAFEITITPEKNMQDADLSEIQGKVIAAVEKLGAKVRDK